MKELTIGYSSCPNDTFVFAHLGRLCGDIILRPVLADIETLNTWAMEARLDVTKVSILALGVISRKYGLLRSGAALGRGCGPIVVAKKGADPSRLGQGPVASPGRWTTASLLLSLYLGSPPRFHYMEFSKVMPYVASAKADFGLVIHEGRFTYHEWGLDMILDLGQWWEKTTGMPIPLGAMAIKRELGEDVAKKVDSFILQSINRSINGEPGTMEYVLAYSQEMALEVVRRHIDLYVTHYTKDLGEEGLKAIEVLLAEARRLHLIPVPGGELLAYE